MKRGPPVRNGGPPPKRSAPSGPMGRREFAEHDFVLFLLFEPYNHCFLNVFNSASVQRQGPIWPPSSQRFPDVTAG